MTGYGEVLEKLVEFCEGIHASELILVSRTGYDRLSAVSLQRLAIADAVTPSTIAQAVREKCNAIVSLIPLFIETDNLVGRRYQLMASLHEAQLRILSFPQYWVESRQALGLVASSMGAAVDLRWQGVYELRPQENVQRSLKLLKELFPELRTMIKGTGQDPKSILFSPHDSTEDLISSLRELELTENVFVVSYLWDDTLRLSNLDPNVTLAYLPRASFLRLAAQRLNNELLLAFDDVNFTLCLNEVSVDGLS